MPDAQVDLSPTPAADPGFRPVAINADGPRPAGAGLFDVVALGDWSFGRRSQAWNGQSWRKLHIGYGPVSGKIFASLLTTEHVGDKTALPELITRFETPVACFLADGAYDGNAVMNCLDEAYPTHR
ncbi:MAG: transposase, partial [Pseudomonadota bacterium]